MEKRKLYYAVVNDNGEQVLNALKQKGGTLSEELAKVTPRNGDIYYIDEDGEIDAYDDADVFQRRVLDEFLGASGVEYVRLSNAEVRDIWRKIYIIADGKEETGKRIIAELEKRGGVNVGNLACTAYHIAYFIEGNGNKITSCDFSKMLDEWGFTRYELPAPTEAEEIKDTIERAADEPEQAQMMDASKVYVVSDGNKRHNAAIIERLHEYGGTDYLCYADSGEKDCVYYLDNKKRIRYGSMEHFNGESNYNKDYTEISLNDCVEEYEKKHPQTSKIPRAFIFGEELKIDFANAIPKGYEVVDEQGDAIESVSFKMRPKRYRPKYKQTYYYVWWNDCGFVVRHNTWDDDPVDENYYKMGNCFKTEKQAQRLADALALQFKTSTALIFASNGK